MARRLEGNGLWEGSRMILPEHKEAYLALNQKLKRREKAELDEQERQLIALAIRDSMVNKLQITLQMYDPFEECKVVGIVERVDNLLKQIRVSGDWYDMGDILAVDVLEIVE